MTTEKTGSPRRASTNPQAEKTVLVGAHWQTTDGDSRQEWNEFNRRFRNPDDPAAPVGRSSGYTAFFTVLTNLMNVNLPISLSVPQGTRPDPLPPIQVNITRTGNLLSLELLPNFAVPAGNHIVLWCTKSVPAGNSSFGPRAFRKCAVLTGGIPAAGRDVAIEYRSVFPMPLSSSKIGIKLQVISPEGLHNVPLMTFGLTPALTMAASADGDNDADLQAA